MVGKWHFILGPANVQAERVSPTLRDEFATSPLPKMVGNGRLDPAGRFSGATLCWFSGRYIIIPHNLCLVQWDSYLITCKNSSLVWESVLETNKHMGVSENNGTPKSSILIGFSIIYHPFWGTSIFGNTHIQKSCFYHSTLFSQGQVPGVPESAATALPWRGTPPFRKKAGIISWVFGQKKE